MKMARLERPLTADEQKEFANYASTGLANLGLADSDAEPEVIVQAVESFVDRWQTARRNPLKRLLARGPDSIEVALCLGSAWGGQLVKRFDWEWFCLMESDQEYYAVAPPDRSAVVYPTYFIKSCLDNPNVDCTVMLAFNMVAAGKIAGLPPSGYENLMQGVHRIVPKR
jgi:hypothetical protein